MASPEDLTRPPERFGTLAGITRTPQSVDAAPQR
jgi:hypothetical protein